MSSQPYLYPETLLPLSALTCLQIKGNELPVARWLKGRAKKGPDPRSGQRVHPRPVKVVNRRQHI